MPRSWIKCLFNPAGSARIINELTDSNAALREENKRLAAERDTLRVAVMTSRETALIQERRINAAEKQTLDRDRQIADLRHQLDEATIEQTQLDEIEKLISEFEKEKKRYEKRIGTLRMQLNDARDALRRLSDPDFEDNPTPIDLRSCTPHGSDLDTASPSDWLQSLPED